MRRRGGLLMAAAGAAALALTACAPSGGPPSTAASTSASSTTPAEPATPVPYAVIVAVDALTVIDGDGAAITTAELADGAATVALLAGATGSTPEPTQDAATGATRYDWAGLAVSVSSTAAASVTVDATAAAGLQLRTDTGLAVGSSAAAALAQGAIIDPVDPTVLRYDAVAVPGTTSLDTAGQPGVDFVALVTDGQAIVRMLAPANDYGDL